MRIPRLLTAFLLAPLLVGCMAAARPPAPQNPPPAAAVTAEPAEEAAVAADEEKEYEDIFAELEEEEMEPLEVWDPIEPVNRGIFWFNDKLYFYLLKPVARVFRVVPEPARISLSNFFSNLGTPARFINAALQGKGADASTELCRFLANSTFGLAGLFDVAKKEGVYKKEEDFGQTLGVYGVGGGLYLVLPILGPTNLRDGVGKAADAFLDPLSYLGPVEYAVGAKALDKENELSLDKDTYESIKKEALDPYLFIRNAYTQNREAKIKK